MVLEHALFWMGGKREARFVSMVERQLGIVAAAAAELEAAARGYAARDRAYLEHARRASALEDEAGRVFDELSSRLATALLPSGEKQDIMGVAQRIEHLAEHIEKAARALLVAEPLALPEELASDLAELAARTRRCVDALALAAAQHRDLPTFMAHAHEVSRAEREAEDASMAILASAVERRGMGVAEELLLRELLLRFEGIADQADAAVDALRILALKR